MIKMIVNGNAVARASACSDANPPPNSSDMPIKPKAIHQKIRWAIGVSVFPPAVMVSMTKEPLSIEVTKNISTRVMPTADVKFAIGNS